MFLDTISGLVTGLTPNDHTRFQCSVSMTLPLEDVSHIGPGTLIAAENIHAKARDKRFTVLQIVHAFPVEPTSKTVKGITFACKTTPVGIEIGAKGKKVGDIETADTYPAYGAGVFVLDDETTAAVIHQIAPESRSTENGSRVDIGRYGSNPEVPVGLDYNTLIRGNAAVISSRPRARTTITNNLIAALLRGTEQPVHVVYCDVNNQGTLSLINLIHQFDNTMVLALNDKFVPQSVFHALKQPGDRQTHKRAVLDYMDMMILPSVLEQRRQDFIYPVSNLLRGEKFAFYRQHEQTIDEFINEIRIDIMEGIDPEVEEYITDVLDGMASTYAGERFNDKNTKDILEMVDEFSQEAKNHAARRTLYDVRAEIQSAFDSFSKDIPGSSRKTLADIVYRLNDETRSSFTVIQGQKTTDILRFIGGLMQGIVDERLKRLKIRVPVLFIFNNADEYIPRMTGGSREAGGDRFQDILQSMLLNGRRHGLGFCMTLEQASALEGALARRIQSYFIGTLRFREEPEKASELINVSEELLHPAVAFEDGWFLFASADSPYHRRVPLPVSTARNTDVLFEFLDGLAEEQERRRKEMQAQEEERARRFEEQRKEEQKRQEERRKQEEERRKKEEARRKEEDQRRKEEEERRKKERAEAEADEKKSRNKRGSRDRGRQRAEFPEEPQIEAVLEDMDDEPRVVPDGDYPRDEADVVIAEIDVDDFDDDEYTIDPRDLPASASESKAAATDARREAPDYDNKKPRPTRRGGRRHKKPGAAEKPEARNDIRTESRTEPRIEPRNEPRIEPRTEPRNEPRIDPRREPKNAPRSEPRSEAKSPIPEKKGSPPPPADKPKDAGDGEKPKAAPKRGRRGGRRSPKKP